MHGFGERACAQSTTQVNMGARRQQVRVADFSNELVPTNDEKHRDVSRFRWRAKSQLTPCLMAECPSGCTLSSCVQQATSRKMALERPLPDRRGIVPQREKIPAPKGELWDNGTGQAASAVVRRRTNEVLLLACCTQEGVQGYADRGEHGRAQHGRDADQISHRRVSGRAPSRKTRSWRTPDFDR
jgi:hypothetical protein